MHAFIIFLNYTGKLTVMEPAFPKLMKQQSKRKKKEPFAPLSPCYSQLSVGLSIFKKTFTDL